MSTPTLAVFKLPTIKNEANVHYKIGSPERVALEAELARMSAAETVYVPALIGGKEVPHAGAINSQPMPHDHQKNLCTFPTTTPAMVSEAIDSALAVKSEWEAMPFNDRAAIFLKVRSSIFALFAISQRILLLYELFLTMVWFLGCRFD